MILNSRVSYSRESIVPPSRFLKLAVIFLLAIWIPSAQLHSQEATPSKIRLLSDYNLSPDGQQICFSWEGDIWTVASQGGVARQLTRNSALDRQPAFSRDGKEVTFCSNRNSRSRSYNLFSIPLAGGKSQQRSFHSEGYSLIEYHPTKDAYIVSATRDHYWRRAARLFTLPMDSNLGEELIFDAEGHSGTLSPDAKYMLFSREGTRWYRKRYEGSQAGQIWLYDIANNKFELLLRDEKGFRYPQWKADGSGFYYVGQQSGSFNLWEFNLGDQSRNQVTFFKDDAVLRPKISRDGSTLIFSHLFDLYRLKLNGNSSPQKINIIDESDTATKSSVRKQLDSASEASFSSDGLEVCFISGGELWVMDTELKEPQRITHSAEFEHSAQFSADGKSIYFVSDSSGESDIYVATRADEKKYWWQNDSFKLEAITHDSAVESNLQFSPDQKQLAYVRGNGDLIILDLESKKSRVFLESWNEPDYCWSPKGGFIAYAVDDNDFNRDVWIQDIEQKQKAYNLSTHPDYDTNPSFSPDGKRLAFTTSRHDDSTEILYVNLHLEDEESSSRDRKMEKAIKKMEKKRKAKKKDKKKKAGKEGPGKEGSDKKAADKESDDKEESSKDDSKKEEKAKAKEEPEYIDFDGLRDRLKRLRIADSRESGLLWVGDSKLSFSAQISGKRGLYSVVFPDELSPKKISDQSLSSASYLSGPKLIAGVSGGKASTLSLSGKKSSYGFKVVIEVDRAKRFKAGFDQAWRAMRDSFYDERMGNRDWLAIRKKYSKMASESLSTRDLSRVISLMLGELNGSHLGFRASNGIFSQSDEPLADQTAHLGLSFDHQDNGRGLLVKEVFAKSPSAHIDSQIKAGERLLEIDGKAVSRRSNLCKFLNGPLARDIELLVQAADGKERTVSLRPTTYGAIRSRLYERWLDQCREMVNKASGDSLGYLHIRGMNWSSFEKFEEELHKIGAGKDGLVIDVRSNGGGFTADHLLTALTQPVHAITVPRGGGQGYPNGRKVYASWSKPIVVLCDQNSFSNAEIFSHAIKSLGRGQLVGIPTAGGVISTGSTWILDLGSLRMPFRGWYVAPTGEDMELNGAVPHHLLWLQPGEQMRGEDSQLQKAIEALKEDIRKEKAKPKPRLRKASERLGGPQKPKQKPTHF